MTLPASDSFTYANNASLPTASAGAWATPTGGAGMGVNANRYYPSNSGEQSSYWVADTPGDNQYAEAVLADDGANPIGVACRIATGANSYYGFYSTSGATQFFKMVGGVWTQFGSDGPAAGLGSTLRIEARGSSIRALVNGVQVMSTTDTALTSGRVGICGWSAGADTGIGGDTWAGGELLGPWLVGAGTAAFTATASATVTPGLPSGWAANDIHLLIASGNNNLDWPEPSGWTKLSPGAVAENNTAGQRVELWARRAVGGDSAPVLSTYGGTTVRGAQIVGIRGCSTAGTVDTVIAAMSRSNNASSTTATFATVTPGSGNDNTLIVALLAYQDNITTAATLTGFTAFDVAAGQRSSLGNDMALSYANRAWAVGSVATGGLTSLTSGAAANVSVGILVALKPVAAAGTTVDLSADPATAAGTAVNPTVVLGSVTVSGAPAPASASGTAITPAVVLGSLSVALSGLPASASGTAVDPTVSLAGGGLTVNASAAPASASGTAIDPSVVQGSLTVAPGAAEAAGTAVNPTVTVTGGGLTVDVSASPAAATSSAVSPTVRQGSLTVAPGAASAAGTAVTPTVIVAGGGVTVNVSAAPASASGTAVSPSVRQGSVSVDVGAATATGTAISPSVIQSSLSLSLAALPALAVGTAITPSVVLVEAFDFPLSALSVVARPGAASTAGRPGASSSGARAGATSTATRPGATSLATRPASTSDL